MRRVKRRKVLVDADGTTSANTGNYAKPFGPILVRIPDTKLVTFWKIRKDREKRKGDPSGSIE